MSATTKLGRVVMIGRGIWNSITEYEPLDIVSHDGSSYLVVAPCVGVMPPNDYYYTLLAARGDTGPQGLRGATGATGAKGDKGDTGTGLNIKGTYASLSALQSAVTSPAQGDMYFVGTAAPYTVYMWDTTTGGKWVSQGELQGAKGDTGFVFTPNVSSEGVISWTNNGGMTNPPSINIKGPQGETGIGLALGGWQGQVLRKATDNDHDTEWATLSPTDIGAASLTDRVAYNLLDNSDFTNPVNQRGQTSYSAAGYTIDRWKSVGALSVTVDDGCITLENTGSSVLRLDQGIPLEKVQSGNTYTVAVCTKDGRIRCGSFSLSTTAENPVSESDFYIQVVLSTTVATVQLRQRAGYKTSYEWVALYEGEYTAENLPKYMPKGYAAELAECQRYLAPIAIYSRFRAVGVTANTIYFTVPIPQTMRSKSVPTIVGSFNVRTVQNQTEQSGFSFAVAAGSGSVNLLVGATKTTHGLTDAQLNCTSDVFFSLEL